MSPARANRTTWPRCVVAVVAFGVLPLASPSPALAGGFTDYPMPTPSAVPFDIASGADGNLWFTEVAAGKVGRVTVGGDVTEFATPTQFSGPQGISAGPPGGGAMWFVEQSAGKVGRIAFDGTITEFTIPTPGSGPQGVTAGPDANLWFTETQANKIGRTTAAGQITEFDVPTPLSRPDGITAGPDGALWFTESNANQIGRSTTSGAITEFPLPTAGSQPRNIATGSDGNLWFSMRGAAKLGRMTPAGAVTEFLLPTRTGLPTADFALDITAGPDGALWYTRPQANVVGRIATDGVIGEIVVPAPGTFPTGITTGPDGRMWVVLQEANRIGALTASPLPLSPPEVRTLAPQAGPPTGGTSVSVTGVNLFDATAVSFGDTPAAGFSAVPGNAGVLSATSPPQPFGIVDVTVTTPRGTTAPSDAARFFYAHPDCGRVITTSIRLAADIGPCLGNGLVVGADNIQVNLNGRRIFGFPGPGDGNAAGIRLPGRSGVIVRSGTISDFDAGVFLDGGRANVLTNLTVRDNVGPDSVFGVELGDGIILFDSAANRIQGNRILRNGIYDGIGVLGPGSNDNWVIANTVEGNLGPSDRGPAGQGIIVNAFLEVTSGQSVFHNHVLSNVVRNNGSAGISSVNNVESTIQGNLVEGNGLTNESGNGIGIQTGPFSLLQGTRDLVQFNTVRGNGENGIEVVSGGNRIIGNTSTGNNVKGQSFWDLFDVRADCGTNVWLRNRWGSAGFRPECVTTGGGPVIAAAAAAPERATRTDPGYLLRQREGRP